MRLILAGAEVLRLGLDQNVGTQKDVRTWGLKTLTAKILSYLVEHLTVQQNSLQTVAGLSNLCWSAYLFYPPFVDHHNFIRVPLLFLVVCDKDRSDINRSCKCRSEGP